MKAARRLILAGCFFLLACAAQAQTVVIVRHYEPMPMDCAVLASKVVSELKASGVDARVISVAYLWGHNVNVHAIAVWRIPGSDRIAAYDLVFINGSLVLDTKQFDPLHISLCLMKQKHIFVIASRFL